MGAASISVPAGLDFGALFAVGQAQGADLGLLGEVAADVEDAILAGLNDDGEEE